MASRSRAASGTTSRAGVAEEGRLQHRALVGRPAEASSGSRSGSTASPPRRVAAGMAARRTAFVRCCGGCPATNGQGRGVPALAEHRDDVGPDVGRGGGGLLDPARASPRCPGIGLGQGEGRAAEAAVGAGRGREEVGQGAWPEGRDDEGQGRGRVLRLVRPPVVLENGPRRLDALGASGPTRPGVGRRGGRARAPPLSRGTRRRRATSRARAPPRGRRCWPGRRGPPGGVASSALSARGRIFFTASRLRAVPSDWMSVRRASRGALSRAFSSALVASGPPMERSAAAAGPASASSTRYFSRGRTDSFFPASWTCERKNAATFASRVLPSDSRRARAKTARSVSAPGRVT